MQTSLETIGQLERRLNVAVPLAEIEQEVDKRLARLAKNVRVAGFRPGHVPLKMIARQYGSQVRSDVISDRVQSSFNDAVREQNLRVAGVPRIEANPNPQAPDQLAFSAVFEVYPDVRVPDLSSVTIERPVAEVTPADVDETIQVLRRQRTRHEVVERGAESGDRVIVDFTGTIDGAEFAGGQARDFAILLGEGRMLPEFETVLAGMRAGERKTFALRFPDDYHGKEVAGRDASFDITVKSVAQPLLPDVDADFAKAFGIASGNLDELRSEITSNLRLELKRKIDAKVKEQALGALRQKADFALPKSLVDAEAESMMQRMAADLKQQGMGADDVAKLAPEMFRANAEERVALGLAFAEIVRTEGLKARPEQVKALVVETAQTYEQPDAVIRWHYEKPERLNEFEAMAVERNVVEWVLARAHVVDKPSTFAELMGSPKS
jgi:trigger factor